MFVIPFYSYSLEVSPFDCRLKQSYTRRNLFSSSSGALLHVDEPFTSVYTFGQPRVLTRKTAQIFNMECQSKFFRFHNNNDLVTRVPARLMGYSHIGTYLYISEVGEIHREIGFWNRFVDSVGGALNDAKEKGLDGIKDHDMAEYLKAIDDWELV